MSETKFHTHTSYEETSIVRGRKYVSTDETTDASGRKVANVVIEVLKIDQTLLEK
jgi:hypothetical protein